MRKSSLLLIILGAIAFVSVLLGGYSAAYFGLSNGAIYEISVQDEVNGRPVTVNHTSFIRIFPHGWQRTLFQPAAVIESQYLRMEVELMATDELQFEF